MVQVLKPQLSVIPNECEESYRSFIKLGEIFVTKSNKGKTAEEFTPDMVMKYEIAEELGLIDKIKKFGWGGLTAKETGRIGGIMTVRKRQNKE